jgi:exodeoxyribonuclease-5
MSELTAHQEEKFKELKDLIGQRKQRILLKGSAGVGKTWLVHTLVKYLSQVSHPEKILCSAPTHKALSVIKNKVIVEDVNFKTIHSALQYRGIIDKETGKREFMSVPNAKYPPLKGLKYLIIDEASMIDKKMVECIDNYASQQRTTVIYVGDDKQLNPVGEEDSPAFMQGYPEVELTEIIRQGEGNPVIDLSRNISKIWSKIPHTVCDEPIEEDKEISMAGYLYTMNLTKIVEELAMANGTDDIKYLAWSNQDVDDMNTRVRKRIYGEYPAKIEQGETIIFDAPYKKYTTNEEVKVNELYKYTMTIEVPLESGPQGAKEEAKFVVYCINKNILVLDDSSIPTFKRYAAITNQNCKKGLLDFETRNEFLSTFAEFKYNHALTIHKSQGSTYKTTILNVKNINFNQNIKEKERLFYTGITRTSKLLILYNL